MRVTPASASLSLISAISLALLAGCSSSDDGGTGNPGGPSPTFASYCTGTLLTEFDLMESQGPGGWMSNGTQGSAPAGTVFLVAASFDEWEGYLVPAGSEPMKINSDFGVGLIRDTDFSSECATDDKLDTATAPDVLLADATFYPNQDLSGEPCVLPAGTELTGFSFFGGSTATVSSNEIKATCGLETSYSNDITYAPLIKE